MDLQAPDESRPTALVVDDEEIIRDFLATVLEMEGYRVCTTASGHEALRRLRAGGVDVILADCFMKEMDGRELYDELQRRGDPLARRMVFMTGDIQDDRVRRLLLETGAPSLQKPFRIAEVRAVVARVLGSRAPGPGGGDQAPAS